MHSALAISAVTKYSAPYAYFLEHFGISLAVNDAAHKLQPQLPLADAYERSLARQLAVLSGQTIGPF